MYYFLAGLPFQQDRLPSVRKEEAAEEALFLFL